MSAERKPVAPMSALLCIVLILAASACSPKKEEHANASETPPAPTLTPEEAKAEALRVSEQKLAEDLRSLPYRIDVTKPNGYEKMIDALQKLYKRGMGTKYEKDIEQKLAEHRKKFDELATKELNALLAKVDEALAKENFDAAWKSYKEWNYDRYQAAELACAQVYVKKGEEIAAWQDGQGQYRELMETARKLHDQSGGRDLVKAIALLESFSDKYQKTPYYAEVRKLIDEYYAKHKLVAAEQIKTTEIEWTSVEIDEHLSHFSVLVGEKGEGVFTAEEGMIKAANSSGAPAWLVGGNDLWKQWIVEFKVKIEDEKMLKWFAMGKVFNPASKQPDFMFFDVPVRPGDWRQVRASVEAGVLTVTVDDEEVVHQQLRRFNAGGYAFKLDDGQKLEIKDVREKLVEKFPEPPKEAPEEEKGKKKKKS